ncbi:MAG TPA: 3-hydroxyacyl-CoA dehydrogenase NAD-binding domain-containing protein [Oligoflexia bacterium]|mgnify:CR=1 FL=1|nr:3-hydroxyacyl-CoA dehydrogenase NAD-binding domain-containing protein [Oligoflexia bacterium]HMR24698.1 3-hydroxyacyl-CoA dehydrogenase NAD-binding domain-containing protein [Oligoflexia bacterium]
MVQKKNKDIDLSINKANIALIGLDTQDKSVNIITDDFVKQFNAILDQVEQQKSLKGLVVYSKKPGQFIAGADLTQILAISDTQVAFEKSRQGQMLMQRIEDLSIPSVAAIDGTCLGGGLELAMACSYRIASDTSKTQMALPEVQIGILPGWGGTQRLPKLIGLTSALDVILTGKRIDAKKAYRMQLVDDVLPQTQLLDFAQRLILEGKHILPKKKKPSLTEKVMLVLQNNAAFRQKVIYPKAKSSILKNTQGFYPAPLTALEVIEKTYQKRSSIPYDIEAQGLAKLLSSDVCKYLVQLFLDIEAKKKVEFTSKASTIKEVAVLGAGVMGGGLAQLFAHKNYHVRLKDIQSHALSKAMSIANKLFSQLQKRKKISEQEKIQKLLNISPSLEYAGLAKADFVLEAVVENMEIKKSVFDDVVKVAHNDAIIASNTSALSINEMSKSVKKSGQFIGMHFFNPVHKMPLVEIIPASKTTQKTLATTYKLALSLGKTPVIVQDSPGFLVNRILGIYLNEALQMAHEGINIAVIDKAIEKFGMPMGPFELLDEVGIDVGYKVGTFLKSQFDYFPAAAKEIEKMIDKNLLGKKSGQGFYLHKQKKQLNKNIPFAQNLSKLSSQVIQQRLIFVMLNEAARCLEAKIVETARDIDIAMILGTGFPPFRGGLCAYAKSIGLETLNKELKIMSLKHGPQFEPNSHLKDLIKSASV